jgi:hypothetical protein
LTFGVGCEPPLGSNARMMVSQKAIRNRNRMLCLRSSLAVIAALQPILAARIETLVCRA